MQIVIDKEFQSLIPPLTAEEYAGLEEALLAEGCRDALCLWGDVLVDGHNRYEICTKHNIPFQTKQMDFASRDDARLWMMRNQLARRNLSDFQRIEIVSRCEDAVRAKARERQGTRTDTNNFVEKFPESRARDELGAMAGVSGKTYEHAITVMENAPEPIIEAARRDKLSINAAYQVTKLEPERQQEVAQRIKNIDDELEETQTPAAIVRDALKKPHVANNSGNNEWYTPADYIELARTVMGSIDLDPATSETAQRTVRAETYYTAQTNGLDRPWHGNVWMNPPYAADLIGRFVDKLTSELPNIEQAIILVNNSTESVWFGKLVNICSAICFPRGRVRFLDPEGNPGAPLQGQAIIYYGENPKDFARVFSEKGWCVFPYELHG